MKQEIKSLENLAFAIQESNEFFLDQVKKQVNVSFTLRNWIIGYHIFKYEQSGKDRAEYGKEIFKKLAERLKSMGVKGLSFNNLYQCRQFYFTYPQIVQTLPEQLQLPANELDRILRALPGEFKKLPMISPHDLVNKLSYTHFIELMSCVPLLKRLFYETETINNNWSTRELQRAKESLLFERTGKSTNKEAMVKSMNKKHDLNPENFFRNPYMLEFLDLEEKPSFTESKLEEAIINHLQKFLTELGHGFCFEARQKRITFNNAHYRIDLVFYHRILKCHVLIELKLTDFSPADVGQMNLYLNYYKDNEMHEDDNPPIGIILCAGKSDTIVKYATGGLTQNLLISQYLTNLPTEKQLRDIIEEEQSKIG